MMPFALIGFTRVPEEQGKWAAETGLRILSGIHPSTIPVTKNKNGQLYLNLDVAERLNVMFPPTMLRQAKIKS
jgi:ABC-type uncharacterized transport system substrate-binding protein